MPNKFETVFPTITLHFPSSDQANFFKSWLSSRGEQDFSDSVSKLTPWSLGKVNYHEPGGSVVVFNFEELNEDEPDDGA